MIRLSDQVLHPLVEHDWHWYFNEAYGEMGLRSNMGGFLTLIERGIGNPGGADFEMDSRQLAAARTAKGIEQAFIAAGRAPGFELSVIDVARIEYGEPPRYGPKLSNLVALLPQAIERAQRKARTRRAPELWLPRLGARFAAGNATKADAEIASDLARAAERLKLSAGWRYAEVRGFARLDRVRAA